MTRKDLQELSRLRLREAQALYKAHFYDGCVYLAGYAVELGLKARICRLLRLEQYPLAGDIGRAFKVHSLDQLKVLAGLTTEIDATAYLDRKLDAMRAHATQITVSAPYFALSNDIRLEALGTEYYTLLAGRQGPTSRGPAEPETDLFAQ